MSHGSPSCLRLALAGATLAGGVAACASGGISTREPTPSVATQAATGEVGPAMLEWTGRFTPSQQQTAELTARGRNAASGTVRLTAPDDRETRVQLAVSIPGDDFAALHWAIAPGACRSGTIPLMAVNEFPELRVARGRGQLDQVIALPLPTAGSYHVNVYSGTGSDESDVLTCSELKLNLRKTTG